LVQIQETYALIGLSAYCYHFFSAFHMLLEYHAYGSAILVREMVPTMGRILCNHISDFAACVELVISSGRLRLSSVYIRPSTLNFLSTLSALLDAVASPFVVIGSDANDNSLLWNSRCNGKCGEELETLLFCSYLIVSNHPLFQLDFVPDEISFVDLTLAGDQVKIQRWLLLTIPLSL
jgi:hypothetical protein